MVKNIALLMPPQKTLVISGLCACLVYFCVAIFTMFSGAESLKNMEAQLASQVVSFSSGGGAPSSPQEDASKEHSESGLNTEDFAAPLPPETSQNSLMPAPFEGLVEISAAGELPVIAPNKLTPFKAYKKPYVSEINKPSIALVVRNFNAPGISFDAALKALPDTVSLLLSPYDEDADRKQKYARIAGHELWLNIAFETERFPADDPGPRGILAQVGLKFNKDNLEWSLSRTSGYAGIAGYMDDAFSEAKPMMRGLMQNIFSRGLGYLELNDNSNGFSEGLAVTQNAPYAQNTLPKDMEAQGVEAVFAALKARAQAQNFAVGVLDLNPVLLEKIEALVAQAEQDGFQIVPLSALADNRL